MDKITKEDVIKAVSTIENPAVLEYLYLFVNDIIQKFGPEIHNNEAFQE